MKFIKRPDLEGQHAILSPSKYYWINYDQEKIEAYYRSVSAKTLGTELHAFAASCIKLKQRLPKSSKTLNMYVNDAIGFKMEPEQVLYFSENCFGTADAISFRGNELRIHDLKTGSTPAHMEQLLIYAGLFCLQYGKKPSEINTTLRIYQNNEIIEDTPTIDELMFFIDRIKAADVQVKNLKRQEE